MIGFLLDLLRLGLMLGFLAALFFVGFCLWEGFIEPRTAERRARHEAAEAAYQAMTAAGRLREHAWQTRRAMQRLDDDIIDVDPDE